MKEEQTNLKGSGFGGKYTRLPSVMREKLNKAMPAASIGRHPSMTFLSTIKSIYVTERLNDVFGSGGWDLETEIIKEERLVHNVKGSDIDYDHVIVRGRLYFREFDLYGPNQFGGHDDKTTMAVNAYKGAVTDCLSKCASLLEIGIQVFKGNPDDRTPGNKSKRLDENQDKEVVASNVISNNVIEEFLSKDSDANLEGMKKPPIEEDVDPIELEEPISTEEELAEAADLAMLQSKHKFLFGKKPNANAKIETLRKKVTDEELRKKRVERDFPLDDAEEAIEVDNALIRQNEEFEIIGETQDGDPIVDETPEEDEVTLESLKLNVDSFTSAGAIKDEAKALDEAASEVGLSVEERSELRNYINNKFRELNK
jgi:hypothetical protein